MHEIQEILRNRCLAYIGRWKPSCRVISRDQTSPRPACHEDLHSNAQYSGLNFKIQGTPFRVPLDSCGAPPKPRYCGMWLLNTPSASVWRAKNRRKTCMTLASWSGKQRIHNRGKDGSACWHTNMSQRCLGGKKTANTLVLRRSNIGFSSLNFAGGSIFSNTRLTTTPTASVLKYPPSGYLPLSNGVRHSQQWSVDDSHSPFASSRRDM